MIKKPLIIHRDLDNVIIEQEPCEDCISRKALIERINNAEENFKFDHIDSISSNVEDPFVDGVLSGVFNIKRMVLQAPSVRPLIPDELCRKRGIRNDNER